MELKEIIKDVPIILETATFKEALMAMITQQSNSLLVVDEEGKLSGEVSVSDLMDGIVPEYLDGDSIAAHFATEKMFKEAVVNASNKEVRDFMSIDTDPVQSDDGLMAIAANAIAHQRARIPVIDDEGRPLGIISRRGLKKLIASFLNIADSA